MFLCSSGGVSHRFNLFVELGNSTSALRLKINRNIDASKLGFDSVSDSLNILRPLKNYMGINIKSHFALTLKKNGHTIRQTCLTSMTTCPFLFFRCFVGLSTFRLFLSGLGFLLGYFCFGLSLLLLFGCSFLFTRLSFRLLFCNFFF